MIAKNRILNHTSVVSLKSQFEVEGVDFLPHFDLAYKGITHKMSLVDAVECVVLFLSNILNGILKQRELERQFLEKTIEPEKYSDIKKPALNIGKIIFDSIVSIFKKR